MSTNSIFGLSRGAVSCALVLAAFVAANIASAQTNPLASDPRAARAGEVIFRAQCATCHGADAKGISTIDAPDLTQMWTQPAMTEARVFERISEGVPGSIMPGHDFPDAEIWMLVSYLSSVAVSGATKEFTGDAESGSRFFSNYCSECHRAANSGGSLGPNLSSITARRTQDALRGSVRNPSAAIGRGFKPVALSLREGEEVRGVIKSEDAFSIQIMDSNQRLRGFEKAALDSIDREIPSLMPVFSARQLSEEQLDDILSFLNQQR